MGIQEVLAAIEQLRKNREISNDAANAASVALQLEGDEAMLANRLINRGSDPASFQLVIRGEISEAVRRAHTQGPGLLKEDEREDWLVLAAASFPDDQKDALPSIKIRQFCQAVAWLRTALEEDRRIIAQEEYEKIVSLPFLRGEVSGVEMRIYDHDFGFAAAYWSGEEYAAVRQGADVFVGSQGRSLEELGVKVDKLVTPTFGMIFGK